MRIENAVFGCSRAYVPTHFYFLYRRGVFGEAFSFGEFKFIIRIFLTMHALDCMGHLAFKWWTKETYQTHIEIDANTAKMNKKKSMEDYVV